MNDHVQSCSCCERSSEETVSSSRLRYIAVAASGVLTAFGLLAHWADSGEIFERILFAGAIVAGGWLVFPQGWKAIRRLSPDMNLLMSVAVLGALFINAWDEAASVVFLFSLSELLESYSATRARRAVSSLMKLVPETVWLMSLGGVHETPSSEARVGDRFLVKPGERISLDGVVTEGRSFVNQAPITGESNPVEKLSGSTVFAGTINGDGALEVTATKVAAETTLARLIHLVESAQERKAVVQRFVDRFARVYTPAVMVLATLLALCPPLILGGDWTTWFYRALVLLVIACPCALVISTPIAIVSSLACAARSGILIKGGLILESLAKITVMAFDKTGTITEGRPRVLDAWPQGATSKNQLMRVACSLESKSNHPIAKAIVAWGEAEGVSPSAITEYQSIPGKGVTGVMDDHRYFAGGHRLALENGLSNRDVVKLVGNIESQAQTVVIVGHATHDNCPGEVLGLLAVGDSIRDHAVDALDALRQLGFRKLIMLSGDNKTTARAVAARIGIQEVHADLLPEDKLTLMKELLLASPGGVGMVGDGVNDAPSLALASVGIAMGAAGSDAAIEAADVALMGDDLRKLSVAVSIGRRAKYIIQQNIIMAIGLKVIFLLLAVSGHASMWLAVAADMGASLLVIGNGFRCLGRVSVLKRHKISDVPS